MGRLVTIRIPFATDAVIRIHDDIIENAGGEFGVLNRGSIAFTIERVNGKVIRENINLCKVTSIILRDFVQGHPFVDGNKRIAFALVDIVLRENGYRFNVGNDEIIEFLLNLAKREFELEGVEEWLMKSVKLK
ncbi:MAG: type II toxin-antitoxin system death-on-curing family toxin [Candidatus Methanogaster sp.]|uniref:Type II toxin-antitoxin system death-on-curing family toxin n=1 Tax=Candidatus Methanogaster sp. TaxID=3386292 RepID=A0AC61L0J3_9EURY|nr:MAG: type II toxin-antitoxin system death-on-curing family toxin [ANME-2 cluster archaeon]